MISDDRPPDDNHLESDNSLDEQVGRGLDAYLAELEAGKPIDADRLLARHPEIADRLREGLMVMNLVGGLSDGGSSDECADRGFLDETTAPLGRSALTTVWQGRGPAPHLLLRDLPGEAGPLALPGEESSLPKGSASDRYHLLGEIARGGMGAVIKGRDNDLGRDLAIKVLLDRHRGDPEVLRRFIEEAQIGGQLQHPGIVPVYELGAFADRRPFFAMKLVQGQTLASLLRERPDPNKDQPRFLGIFAQICQTMAYAHARGVIHRDLKPANIMIGSFGEVQVMDWGLAKVLARGGVADEERPGQKGESTVRTVRSGSAGTESLNGSVMGTPAYMAPEQARGDMDRVDKRCDVFGLGAILGEILTGQAPFTGQSHGEIVERAARADLTAIMESLAACDAERELMDLARDCLAAEPEDRPCDAAEVARRMTAFLAGVQERLHAAEIARVEAQAKAIEERKRRKLVVALASAIIGFVVLGGGGGFWLEQQRSAARARTELALRGVELLRDEAVAAVNDPVRWAAAVQAARQAEIASSDATTKRRAVALRQAIEKGAVADARDRTMLAALEEARLQQSEVKEGHFDKSRVAMLYGAAFRTYGVDVEASDEAELITRLKAPAIRDMLAAALDDWAWRVDRALGQRLARLAEAIDPDPTRSRLRTAFARRDTAALVALSRRNGVDDLLPPTLAQLGSILDTLGEPAAAASVLRRAQSRHPDDLWINHNLADALVHAKPPRLDEAIGFYRAALALRPRSPGIHVNLCAALRKNRKLAEAEAAFREAIRLKPDYAAAHTGLGDILNEQRRFDEAETASREAIRLKPDFAGAYVNLGISLKGKGRLDEAIAACRESIRLKPEIADAHDTIGKALQEQGKLDEAITAHREAIRREPGEGGFHLNLGIALQEQGKLDEALASYREAMRLKPDFAEAHVNLGALLCDEKQEFAAAESEFREAIRLKPDLPEAHANLGTALLRQQNLVEALTAYRRAGELVPPGSPLARSLSVFIRQIEQNIALATRLPSVLKGDDKPADVRERIEFARLCHEKGLYAAASHLWTEALNTDPKLTDDREAQYRYDAACAAALAGCGIGKDDPPPDDAAKKKLREQALKWLRAELSAWKKVAQTAEPGNRPLVAKTLRHWGDDADLAGVRDAATLSQLSEDERKAWLALWADVGALLKAVSE